MTFISDCHAQQKQESHTGHTNLNNSRIDRKHESTNLLNSAMKKKGFVNHKVKEHEHHKLQP